MVWSEPCYLLPVKNADVTNDDNAAWCKYKASISGNTEDNGRKTGVKIAVLLKYLSNFSRPLEMPLINCKVERTFKLDWKMFANYC